MTDFLPKDVQDGLDAARKRDLKRRSRLRVLAGDEVYPILRFWGTASRSMPTRCSICAGLWISTTAAAISGSR